MSRLLAAIAILALLPQLGNAQDKKDVTAELLAKLRTPVEFAPGDVKLTELAELLTEKHGVATTINTTAFTLQVGEAPADANITISKVQGLPLAAMLRQVLAEKNATYLVRKGHIEIVPIELAIRQTKLEVPDDGDTSLLPQALVSAIYKEKPLNEALADLAEEHDLTIVLAPQAADNKAAFVSARMLNVPADQAIDMLALQADLRVVKKGASYFVTSKDHAAELENEKFEKEQRKLEFNLRRLTPLGQPAK